MPDATVFLIFFTSFFVGLSGAVAPGPLLMVNIAEAARRGFRAGPALALGHSLLELGVVVLLLAGLSQALQRDAVTAAVGILGGSFLLWMGWRIVRGTRTASLAAILRSPASLSNPGAGPVLTGVLASLSNPFWLIWWLTVGATYMVWSLRQGAPGVVSFYLGHILADFLWYSLVAFVVATGRRFMSDAAYRGVLVGCGVFLAGLGLFFFASGLRTLL